MGVFFEQEIQPAGRKVLITKRDIFKRLYPLWEQVSRRISPGFMTKAGTMCWR